MTPRTASSTALPTTSPRRSSTGSTGRGGAPIRGSIAFEHVDERGVPPFAVTPEELHRYPFAGGPNARVGLRVASMAGSAVRDVDLGMRPDDYLARVVPHPEGGWLVAVLPREQRSLRWHRVGADASAEVLWTEEAEPWVNLDDLTRILPDGRILALVGAQRLPAPRAPDSERRAGSCPHRGSVGGHGRGRRLRGAGRGALRRHQGRGHGASPVRRPARRPAAGQRPAAALRRAGLARVRGAGRRGAMDRHVVRPRARAERGRQVAGWGLDPDPRAADDGRAGAPRPAGAHRAAGRRRQDAPPGCRVPRRASRRFRAATARRGVGLRRAAPSST